MDIPLAIKKHTALFQNRIISVTYKVKLFKPGRYNKKLGPKITKGRWKGKSVYSLTLVERETCPVSCFHWDDCYGNHLHFSQRFKHGKELEDRIKKEIPILLEKHPKGIVVRLHVLGDFYSLRYCNVWRTLLRKYDKLSVFGYTAHLPGTSIGDRIQEIRNENNSNFVIRISANEHYNGNYIFAANESFMGKVFLCPQQTDKVKSCSECAICWQSQKTVIFKTH